MASYFIAAGVFTHQQFGFGPIGDNVSAGGVGAVGYPHVPGFDEYARIVPPPLPLELLERWFQNDTSNVSAGGSIVDLAASIAGVAAVTASQVIVQRALAATPAGTATIAAAANTTRPIAATVAGVATIAAALKTTRKVAAAVAGVATISAPLKATRAVAAAVAGVATIAAQPLFQRRLATAVAGVGAVTPSTLVVQRRVQATVAGTGAVSFSLSLVGFAPQAGTNEQIAIWVVTVHS